MFASSSAPLVHYFDTTLHRVPCGARGSEQRSTKHARNVTCQACVAFLRAQTTSPAHASGLGDAHA